MSAATTKKIHEGRNLKRFPEMPGIKQGALAAGLCNDWNQQKVSLPEQKEMIDPDLLQQISAALKIPAECKLTAVKNNLSFAHPSFILR